MSNNRDSQLADQCRATAEAASRALAWFDDNKDEVRQEHASLLREFRKFAKSARKLADAVERPMCVGVFGPSQTGKSYLISAFARRGTNPLIAEFDGLADGLDFVRQINPEGGAESTGLVTRFSMRRIPAPAGFPVPVRLLSQADIVKIIGNTFFSDCDLSEEDAPDAAAILKAAEAARGKVQAAPLAGLTEDDVWDIQEYFERQFKGDQIVRALSSGGYWNALAELAPRLPLPARAELFSLLWGGIEQFTALYARLTGALDKLGHAPDAFCTIEALVQPSGTAFERRSDSVIDVHTLQGLGAPAEATLGVRGVSGATASLSRPDLTALIAELHVAMRERPWDFLEHTDLLDFPGARSREMIENVRTYLARATKSADTAKQEALGGIEGLFLRGKVAYLFERYNVEQELTSMLLCIAPSNQEVRTVPGMVKDWIDVTHGADPQAREKTETALFFVLTKFDAEFQEAAGQSDDSTARWTRRLNTSLLDFFGKAHRWPHEWTPGQPFNNCFWLRNPNFQAKHIIDYNPDKSEAGIRASEAERIARQRSEYLTNDVVRRHFRDPGKAWDEAFRLNDGGVSYLAQSIAPVCNPHIKARQIATRLDNLRKTMRERLQRYHVTEDLAEQREQRGAAAREVVRSLLKCAAEQRFGGLIRVLQTSDIELGDVFFNLETRRGHSLPRGPRIDGRKVGAELGIDADEDLAEAGDTADLYADAAVEHWVEAIRSLANNPRVCRHFKVPETAMSDLIDELIAGSVRLDLRGRVADDIRPAIGPQSRVKDAVVKPALLAANAIGAFIFWLGYDKVAPGERPTQRNNAAVRIFQPRPPMDFPELEAQPSSFDERYYRDWFTAYFDLVARNSESVAGRSINVEQNSRIGTIITSLAEAARASPS
jgi:hypothetical protein